MAAVRGFKDVVSLSIGLVTEESSDISSLVLAVTAPKMIQRIYLGICMLSKFETLSAIRWKYSDNTDLPEVDVAAYFSTGAIRRNSSNILRIIIGSMSTA